MTTSFAGPMFRALGLENIIDMKKEMLDFIGDEMKRSQPHPEGNFMERFLAEAGRAVPGSRLECWGINMMTQVLSLTLTMTPLRTSKMCQ